MGQSNSKGGKSGLTDKLYQCGFEPERGRNHITWICQGLIDIVKEHNIDIYAPENFKSGREQAFGKVTVPHNPATHTMTKTEKYITWCKETYDAIKANPAAFPKKSIVATQFANNAPRRAAQDDTGTKRKNKPRWDKASVPQPA